LKSHITQRNFFLSALIANIAIAFPAISIPELHLAVWFGGVSNPENSTQLSFEYAVNFDITDERDLGMSHWAMNSTSAARSSGAINGVFMAMLVTLNYTQNIIGGGA
jgi:hypothetical protein